MPDDVSIKISGNTDDLKAAMDSLGASVSESLNKLNDSLRTMSDQAQRTSQDVKASNEQSAASFKSLQTQVESAYGQMQAGVTKFLGAFNQMLAILAGGAIFKDVIDSTIKWESEVSKLSRTLGITMRAASDLNVGLRLVGTDADTYTHALSMLERQLRTNEQKLKDWGMVTRDANEKLVDGQQAMKNALAMIELYEQGLLQGQAGQVAFGRGGEQIAPMLLLNDQVMARATKTAKDLGLEIGTEDVKAMRAYRMEVNEAKLVLEALEHKIGVELMEVLKNLASFFNEQGVTAVGVFESVLKELGQIIEGLTVQARVLMETLRFIGEAPAALNRSAGSFHFGGGIDPLTGTDYSGGPAKGEGIVDLFNRHNENADNIIRAFEQKYETGDFVGPPTPAGLKPKNRGLDQIAGKGGNRKPPGDDEESSSGKSGAEDLVAQWEEALKRIKDSQSDLNSWSTAKEYEFWNDKLSKTQVYSDQWWQIWHKMADQWRTMLSEQQAKAKEAAKQEEEVDKIRTRSAVEHEQAMYDLKKGYIDRKLHMGMISDSQALQMEKQMLDERYRAQIADLQRRIELLKQDPDRDPKKLEEVYAKMKQLTDKYWKDEQQLETRAITASMQKWQGFISSITSSFSSAIKGLINQTMTWQQAMTNVLQGLIGAFIDMCMKMVEKWIASKVMEIIFGKTTAQAEITSQAAAGAASAGAAVAGIPVIGPSLIGPTMAAAYAQIMGAGSLANAVGYDVGAWRIPSDQLAKVHKDEVIIPSAGGSADQFREMFSGRGGPGGDIHLHVHAIDAKGVRGFFDQNGHELAKALKKARRDGLI